MDQDYILNIAGLPLVFEGRQWREHIRRIENRYIFCDTALAAREPIRLGKMEARPLQDDAMPDDYVRYRRRTSQDSYEFFHHAARAFAFDFDRCQRCGTAHVLPAAMDSEKFFPINGRRYPDTFFNRSFDMLAYAVIAALYGGTMFHAASLVDPLGRGVVLCGPSGIGKTTVANKLQQKGFTVLDDDTAAIMPMGSGYNLYPLPWDRDVFREYCRGTPLTTVVIIRRATGQVSVYEPLSFSEGVRELAGNVRCLRPIIRAHSRVMQTLVELTQRMNCGILYHSLQDPYLPVIGQGL